MRGENSVPRRRRWLALAAALGAVALLAAGWVAAMLFVSPDQRAASATAPAPSQITATVARGDLESTSSGRARVDSSQTTTTAIGAAEGVSVVSYTPLTNGDTVQACGVAIEVSGRPRIVVEGEFAYYRDVHEGDEGRDVDQLRAALVGCGVSVPATGAVDRSLMAAVQDLYAATGYSPPGDVIPLTTEFVVVPTLPAVLHDVPEVGSEIAGDATLNLGSGELTVFVEVPTQVLDALDAVTTIDVHLGEVTVGATQPEIVQEATDEAPALARLTIDDGTDLTSLATTTGTAVFQSSPIAEDSLIVPATAVVSAGAEGAFVYKRGADGDFTPVEVVEVGYLDGRSAVTQLDGKLEAGDVVLVGRS